MMTIMMMVANEMMMMMKINFLIGTMVIKKVKLRRQKLKKS